MVTFTGSARAGWAIRQRAYTKRVTLELGGNAAVIVEPDADIAARSAAMRYRRLPLRRAVLHLHPAHPGP